jgi:hypothetical protein
VSLAQLLHSSQTSPMRSGVKAVAFAEIDTTLPPTCAGRLALRIAFDEQQDVFQVVHINEPSPIESTAYLIKYDSVHGEKGTTSAQRTSATRRTCMLPLISPHYCISPSICFALCRHLGARGRGSGWQDCHHTKRWQRDGADLQRSQAPRRGKEGTTPPCTLHVQV